MSSPTLNLLQSNEVCTPKHFIQGSALHNGLRKIISIHIFPTHKSFSFHTGPTKTEITVQFTPLAESGVSYKLQWKEHSQSWEAAKSKTISADGANEIKAVAENLQPGTTYCVRLVTIDSTSGEEKGSPSPELVVDTEQVGCTPKSERGCCTIL